MSVSPEIAKRLVGVGWEVVVQAGAGAAASFTDDAYREAGATVAPDAASVYAGSGLITKLQMVDAEEAALVPEGGAILSFLQPAAAVDALRVLVGRKASAFSFDLVPRISRAQSMDALSSQATVSGYRAALMGSTHLSKFFPMFMTAAGTVPPAKVLVMGVGVAGLQAIATARRLGAVVRAYDVRAAAKEEAESLGATFVNLPTGTAEGTGGYARELTPEELQAQQEALTSEVAALGRGDHDGRRARSAGPGPRDHGHGRPDVTRRPGRRHGRRLRWELRTVRAGTGDRPRRCLGHRDGQPAGRHGHPRQFPLLTQYLEHPDGPGPRGLARPRLGR